MLPDDMKEELVQGLTGIFYRNMSMIILYGSVARGDATDESDMDIAIIIKKEMDNQIKKRFISWAADMDIRYGRIFSIVDIQEENMRKWERVLPFYQNIRKEGVVLWRAAKKNWQDIGWREPEKCCQHAGHPSCSPSMGVI